MSETRGMGPSARTPSALRYARSVCRALIVVALVGIGSSALSGCVEEIVEPAPRIPFIALTSDFADFLSWPSIEIAPVSIAGGHPVGPSHVYLSSVVPFGDEEPFETGTMIVKTVETGAFEEWEVHAMAKRGGDYNVEGAAGWEWLELSLGADGTPAIGWRGEGSAANPGGYVAADGGLIPCNDCHIYAWRRDYIFTRLTLRDAGL